MAKWIKWFASFVYSSSKSEAQFTENLALSLSTLDSTSGWYIIESDDDIRADLQAQKERKARESEIAGMVSSFQVKPARQKDWLKSFADLLLTLPEEEQEIAFNSLPSDMRISIINRVLKLRGQQWLEMIEKLFWEIKGVSKEASAAEAKRLIEDLHATWNESSYEKGRIGALRDFTMLSYTEERLSPKLLKSIHSSLVKSVQVLFRVQLQCQLKSEHVTLIEDALALAIPDLIALHCQSAKISHKAHGKEGKLPAKWKEDDAKLAQKLSEIKARGVDAKWEEPVPYKPPTKDKASLDLKEATQVLDKLLTNSPTPSLKNTKVPASNEESDLSMDEAIAELVKVHVHEDERMKMEDLEHHRNFLLHTLFSARRLSARAIGSSA